jgi:hypothetical protein
MKSAAELAELRRRENKRDDCISGRGSKVFELSEKGIRAARKPERFNVFAKCVGSFSNE